jgi:hypothetical protein
VVAAEVSGKFRELKLKVAVDHGTSDASTIDAVVGGRASVGISSAEVDPIVHQVRIDWRYFISTFRPDATEQSRQFARRLRSHGED